jgi:CRP/FNR family cyclic AMP-dependent transcriptional regulator
MSQPAATASLTFPLFGPLSAEDSAALSPLLRPRRYEAGQVIMQRGDPAEEAFLVTAGQLRVSVCSADGRELAFRVATRGDMVGEIGVLDDSARTADVTALRTSDVLVLTRADLRRLLTSRSAMAMGAIRFLCGRLRDTSEQLEALALQRVEARLAGFLLRLVTAAGPVRDQAELTLGISQSEIGALIGASRPKVNGAFSALEEQGAIRRDGKKLHCRIDILGRIVETSAD